jgi:hypothetical protein
MMDKLKKSVTNLPKTSAQKIHHWSKQRIAPTVMAIVSLLLFVALAFTLAVGWWLLSAVILGLAILSNAIDDELAGLTQKLSMLKPEMQTVTQVKELLLFSGLAVFFAQSDHVMGVLFALLSVGFILMIDNRTSSSTRLFGLQFSSKTRLVFFAVALTLAAISHGTLVLLLATLMIAIGALAVLGRDVLHIELPSKRERRPKKTAALSYEKNTQPELTERKRVPIVAAHDDRDEPEPESEPDRQSPEKVAPKLDTMTMTPKKSPVSSTAHLKPFSGLSRKMNALRIKPVLHPVTEMVAPSKPARLDEIHEEKSVKLTEPHEKIARVPSKHREKLAAIANIADDIEISYSAMDTVADGANE